MLIILSILPVIKYFVFGFFQIVSNVRYTQPLKQKSGRTHGKITVCSHFIIYCIELSNTYYR